MGRAVFPPCCFIWGQTMVEVMKIMLTSFNRCHASTAALSDPALQQATTNPRLCRRLLATPGQVRVSPLWGHCCFLLGPGAHRFCLCPSRVCFPVLCKFCWLYCGVDGDLLQEGLCHTWVYCTQSPCPLKNTVLAQSLWGLWVLVHTRFVWALRASLSGIGLDSKCDFTPPIILPELLLCP